MRGEHWKPASAMRNRLGSSPHARGAQLRRRAHRGREGIIPACAGSTRGSARRGVPPRDHPRMRGEHESELKRWLEDEGSSPHARGALRHRRRELPDGGIIPACAGSTPRPSRPRRARGDHPRMRGEHTVSSVSVDTTEGSSPHARGARAERLLREAPGGIIPACAGSTYEVSNLGRVRRDHPRMRGEHSFQAHAGARKGGSSPHARGAHVVAHREGEHVGIIPACAGSTQPPPPPTSLAWDHPRMRGEHDA